MRFCCKHDFRLLKADLLHQPKFRISRKGQCDTVSDGVEEGEKLLFLKLFLEENVLNVPLSLSLQNYLLCVRDE